MRRLRILRNIWNETVMNYIDRNPVTAGLTHTPEDWKASGAYYKAWNIWGLVDFSQCERQRYVKMLSPIPSTVVKLLPPTQLAHVMQYQGVYTETIDRLFTIVIAIPKLGATEAMQEPLVYLHYFTGTADYFICEYDGEDIMYGRVRFQAFPEEEEYRKFSLAHLKSNQFIELDFSWVKACLAQAFRQDTRAFI